MSDSPLPYCVAFALLLGASTASAQVNPTPGATDAAPAAGQPAPAVSPDDIVPELPRAETGQYRQISRVEALRLALGNSPELRVAELGVKSARQQVLGEQGRYPYYLNADAGYTHSTSTQLRPDDSVASSSSESVNAGLGLRRQFAAGTLAEVRAEGEYFHLNGRSAGFGVTPFAASGYGSTFRASVTQPLLRGYGTEVGEAELRAARVSETASKKALLRTKSSLIGDVLSAYFELWYASRSVDIETSSLALAREQRDEARTRLELGAISRVDLLAFETRAAELEEALIAAELTRQQRSVTLSQMMGQKPLATDLFASSDPNLAGRDFEQASVEAAMRADSIELAELEEQVRLARTRAEVAGESWRPRLDVEAWATSSGVSTEFPNAWARAARGEYWSAHGGVVFDMPLDDSGKNAEQMKAALAVESAKQQLEIARRRVGADATSAIASERSARERLASAIKTTAIAREAYMAERERYELGQTVVIAVQEAEAALRRARLREARARVDAAQARLVLLHLTGGLLATASEG